MKFFATCLALGLALLATPAVAGAGGPVCPDRSPDPITAPGEAGVKCQQAIAKEGAKFLKTKTGALSKCLLKSAPGSCPAAADTTKIEQAALKATEKIAKACADDAAQAALGSSYQSLTDDSAISSCALSQHNAVADIVVLNATGISTEDWPGADNKARSKCISEASKTGIAVAQDLLAAASKCLGKQIQAGTAGDLAPICLGSIAAGNFVIPSDPKTAAKFGKVLDSAAAKIAKKCAGGQGSWLPSLFACDGATTAAGLSDCLVCQGYQSAIDLVEQEYAENGSLVVPGADAIETAVNAAPIGAKLLIAPGDYSDVVTIETAGLQLVGCGGATGDRPRIVKPAVCGVPEDCARGVFASDVDGLVFQSLEVADWTGDGIFVTGAVGVTFRDIIGDGGAGDPQSSRYAVFPVNSEDILIETCDVRDISDAGIYVGQSSDIMLRWNKIQTSVAGIEFENSANGIGHNNYATGNTGGILVFKDGSLPVQLSNDHRIAHNVLDQNNGPNYGSGNVAGVPEGTGILMISTDDSVFEYNVITGNNSFGIAVTDQMVAEFGPPFSSDQKTERNSVLDNVVTGNGGDPDDEAPFAADILMALAEFGDPGPPPVEDHFNCFLRNVVDQPPIFLGLTSQCP